MNTNDSNSLIDESEIRAALSLFRIDRDAFGHGVRQRVEQVVIRPANNNDANLKDRGGLLRIAGSVLPVNVFGANTTASQAPLAAMGFFPKGIAYLALPAVSFLMIVVTICSWFRIHVAQQSQSLPEADMARMQESINGWWQSYGWIAVIVFALTLAAPFIGWTTPLLLLFMASAIGTASIVTTLGRAGLVDRSVIGGYCVAMLGLLGQVSVSFAISNHTQLLDPHLVTAVFFAGTAFLFFFVTPFALLPALDAKPKESRRNIFLALAATGILVRSVAVILLASGTVFFGQTLWKPIETSTLVRYAETFEPELVGSWSYWQVTARWLQDQGIDYDHSVVQTRWLEALDKEDSTGSYLLHHAVSTGLIYPPELIETEKFKATTQRLLSPFSAGTQITSITQYEYIIALLAKEGNLSDEQRDHLAGRLLATWRSLHDDQIQESLIAATTITNLLSLIDRPLAEAERKADVDRWLEEYQVISSHPFTPSGGFKRYSTLNSSDLLATEHAVRLMQHYGTYDGVDLLALRAFLRPMSSDRRLMMTASVRASARMRLDQIPEFHNRVFGTTSASISRSGSRCYSSVSASTPRSVHHKS